MKLFTVPDPLNPTKMVLSRYPQTEEAAKLNGLTKYWPGIPCPIHGAAPVHFVGSHSMICCVRQKALDAQYKAMLDGEPQTLEDAMTLNKDYYINDTVFRCGHYGKHTLTGKCYECSRNNSPRMVAIRVGQVWYTPTTPCPRGHFAKRRTDNGQCETCRDEDKAARKEKRTKDRIMPFYKQFPDLVISWKAARAMGLNVYRTGEPCPHGHSVYRYVQSRGCLACMGRG